MSFWADYQPGFRYSPHPPGTTEFFRDVEAHRYRTEPGIPELVNFPRWAGRDILELGCGIATDGVSFARHGARYTGLDGSPTAVRLARERLQLERLPGTIIEGTVTALPFPDASFDLVYSNGVLHHTHGTEQALREARRVLRPHGRAIVMLYHRRSLNYHFNIMVARRVLAATLRFAPGLGRLSSEPPQILRGHQALLDRHGWRYLTDRQLFLNNNTDGPGNPLSKVYTREEAESMFRWAGFHPVTETRFLNLRMYPGGERLQATRPAQWLARRVGWHLWVLADPAE